MSQPSTEVIVRENTNSLRTLLEKQKGQLAAALPKNFGVDRFVRTCITLYQTAPGLAECDPMSVLVSAMRAAELGLELSSPLGQAYLVPFKNGKRGGVKEAQLQIGYRGLISLGYRSKQITVFTCRIVHEKDQFRYQYGTDQFIEHKPCEDDDPGKVTHYYAVIHTTMGGRDFEVMTARQVERHRVRFSKQPNGFGWRDHFDAMALKTVIRKLAKRCPMIAELCDAAAEDEMVDGGMIPARANPLTGDVIEGFLVGPNDDGVGEPDVHPVEQPAKSRTERVAEKVGAGT